MRDYLPPLSESGRRWARFLGLIFGVLALLYVAQRLAGVLTPLAIALAIAYILNPVVTWLERRRDVPRVWSVSVGLAILGLGVGVFTLHWTVQTVELLQQAPRYAAQLVAWTKHTLSMEPMLDAARDAIDRRLFDNPETQPAVENDGADPTASPADTTAEPATSQPTAEPMAAVQPTAGADADPATRAGLSTGDPGATAVGAPLPLDAARLRALAQEYAPTVGQLVKPLYDFVAQQIASITYWMTLFVLIPLYTFVFLLHFNQIIAAGHDHLPIAYRATIVRIVTTIDAAIADFFRGRLVVCAAVGLLTTVGWGIVGLDNNLLLGVLAGVLNLIPFISGVVLVPALLLAYFGVEPGESWITAVVSVFVVFMIVQAIESFVLSPIVLAQSSGLHPMTTVIALLIGAELAGVLGMLLAIPLASTIKSLGKEFVLPEIRRLAGNRQPAGPPPTPPDGASQEPDA